MCSRRLPLDHFYKSKSSSNGALPRCKQCRRCSKLEWRRANPEANRALERARVRDPEKMRAAQARWRARNRTLAGKRSAASRLKKVLQYKERNRARKKAFPETVRAHDALRRARRANAPGLGWSAADVVTIKRLQRGRCAMCRVSLPGRFHRDHIIPLKHGGAHDRRNLQLLCEPCNLSKGARDPLTHARTRGLLL